MATRVHVSRARGATFLVPALVSSAALTASPAARADPQANTLFAPLRVEAAIPIERGVLEAEFSTIYVRDPFNERGRDLTTVQPLLRLGAAPGLHVTAAVPYRLGDQSRADQGDGLFGFVYNLNDQSDWLPAFGVALDYATPYGSGHKTAEYFVRGLATKWLGPDRRSPRLHVNVGYRHLTQPSSAERPDRLDVAAGGSFLVGEKTALFFDVVHGAKYERRQTQTFLEAAVQHQAGDWLLSGGAGVGVGAQSPDFRLLFTVRRAFKVF